MTNGQPRVAVLGAGSWGTALASHLASQGVSTTLWAREREVVDGIAEHRRNPLFLTGVDLPPSLAVTADLAAAARADVIVSAIPVPHIRNTLTGLTALRRADIVVTVSKGIEPSTLSTPHQILVDLGAADGHVVALSGPSFAREVAAHLPTAVVAAGADFERTRRVQDLFSTDRFRVYTSDDIVGVEIGGAMKNVIALAAGASDGLELGDNTRAAIITRGLAEITRLGVAMGGHPETFSGLSGIGDLMLTCAGGLSRNRSVGLAIGAGRKLADISAEMNEVAEGVSTCRTAHQLAGRIGVEMPITHQMYQLLYEDKDPLEALNDLLGRQLRNERATP